MTACVVVIRVLLAEDQRMLRDLLVRLLDLEPDLEVVAQVASGDRVVEAARQTRPDVALLDIKMPGLDGLAAAEEPARAARLPPGELADTIRRVMTGQRVVARSGRRHPHQAKPALAARTRRPRLRRRRLTRRRRCTPPASLAVSRTLRIAATAPAPSSPAGASSPPAASPARPLGRRRGAAASEQATRTSR